MSKLTKSGLMISLPAAALLMLTLTLSAAGQMNSAPAQKPTPAPPGMKRPDPQF